MRPPPLNLLGLAPLARPPGWCQLPPTLGCPPGPGGVSTDLQTVLGETSKASPPHPRSAALARSIPGALRPSFLLSRARAAGVACRRRPWPLASGMRRFGAPTRTAAGRHHPSSCADYGSNKCSTGWYRSGVPGYVLRYASADRKRVERLIDLPVQAQRGSAPQRSRRVRAPRRRLGTDAPALADDQVNCA
jgi:hypothetical protein